MRRLVLLLCLIVAVLPAHSVAADLDLIRPVHGSIIRHFEPPPTPYAAGHRGIDMGVPAGTRVLAAASGTISFAGAVAGSLFVSIDHDGGLRTTYSFLLAVLVKKNQHVEQGDLIARSGHCHPGDTQDCLHFGVRRGQDYLDPEPMLLRSIRRNLSSVIRLGPEA